MNPGSRPLSPHLQVYKPQITSVLSILHRITGVALAFGALLLVWWLVAAATGPDYFKLVQGIVGSWVGRLFLFGWTWALFYHLCNGIRHLFWDAGRGFDLPTVRASGLVVVAASLILTLGCWVGGYASMGGM
jgi:succinate dehydrogenase / fumarate reductase cytochrome b subunit